MLQSVEILLNYRYIIFSALLKINLQRRADFFMNFDKSKFKEQLEKEQEERYKLQAESIAILQEYKEQIQKLYTLSPKNASILQFEALNNNLAEKQEKLYSALNSERNKLYLKEVNKLLIDTQYFTRRLLTPFYLSPLEKYICELFKEGTLQEAISFYHNFTKKSLELDLTEEQQITILYKAIQQKKEAEQKAIKLQGLYLSKKAIDKYFIKEEIFTGERGKKDLETLFKDRVVISAVNRLKAENKHSQNLSNEEIIKQALDYYKEKKLKEFPKPKKNDKRQNQYKASYIKANDDFDIILSNNVNNAFYYCNGKNTNSRKGTGKFKDYQVIKINPQSKHPIYIIFNCEKPVNIREIFGAIWDLILQAIYKKTRKHIGEIIEAIKHKTPLDEELKTIKTPIVNQLTAFKMPADSKNFSKYRTDMKNDCKDFCKLLNICGIKARYKTYKREWKEFWGSLFELISVNDKTFEIEMVLTDDYIKLNALTLSSKILTPIESISNADFSHYPSIYNLHKLFYIFNRINGNEIREVTIKAIFDFLGFDIEELRKQEKLSLIPKKIFNYLNELTNKFDMSFLFDNKELSTLENYKWSSKRITKDFLEEFFNKKIQFTFNERMEKILKNYKPKSPIEYYNEYLNNKKKAKKVI